MGDARQRERGSRPHLRQDSSMPRSLFPVGGVRMEREGVVWRVSLQADCKSQSESVRSRSGQVKAKRGDSCAEVLDT